MHVLVTGATGLVGANTTRALLAAGHTVRVAHRASSNTRGIDGLDVERAELDINDVDAVRAAAVGCDGLVHSAAAVWVGATGREWLQRVNVEGTDIVCKAAREAGVKRMVHVSTVDALGIRSKEHPADEDVAPNMDHLDCAYVDTKREAEQVVLRHVEQGLACVIVNPTYMLGPNDVRPSSGEMILEVARGKGLFAPPGGNNFVDVRDVAAAIVTALERGEPGRRYILGGENLTYREAWTRIAHVVGRRPPLGTVPAFLPPIVGFFGGIWGRITGREPVLNPVSARMGNLPHYFDPTRARTELEMASSDLDTAIADAWAWFRQHDYS